MKRLCMSAAVIAVALLVGHGRAGAHCEMPCGIFDDPARFTSMMESQGTIAKAMAQIAELAPKSMEPQSFNQGVRWVNVKDEHAENVMQTLSQYFMAQRIKAPTDANAEAQALFVDRLVKAHAGMVAAMKCKQTVDAAQAEALKTALQAFQKSYEAK